MNGLTDASLDSEDWVLLRKLQGLVKNMNWSPSDAADLFVALLERFDSGHSDRSRLQTWLLKILHLMESHFITPTWKCLRGAAVQLVRDAAVSEGMLRDYFSQEEEKHLGDIIEEIRREMSNQVGATVLGDVRDIVSSVSDALCSENPANLGGIKGDLLRLCRAVDAAYFRPHLTQMVSWCILALSETGQFIQVATGEGKSCIVAMFAAYRAMKGETVHILTSSLVLAQRDMETWSKLFQTLKITVDCNTNKEDINALRQCYQCQVIYGTTEKFAGDYLKQCLQRIDIFGQTAFQCAIVDEEDSIMLDKALHVIYISGDMPALQHLNALLAFIWATVNQYGKIDAEVAVGPKCTFLQVALDITRGKDLCQLAIFQMAEDAGVLPKGSARVLKENPTLLANEATKATVSQLARFFTILAAKLPRFHVTLHCQNSDGSLKQLNGPPKEGSVSLLLLDGGSCCHLYGDAKSLLSAIKQDVKERLRFTPCELTGDQACCLVPSFLSGLVTSKLDVWIRNALTAQKMTEGHEYVLERQRVVPVDYSSTGVLENFMTWSDGLHQFLELKHNLKLSNMTPISTYMSNIGLLQKYGGKIFGLTGTLGQRAERDTAQKIYGVDTCRIPPFKRKKLFEVAGAIVDEEEEWIKRICRVVSAHIQPTAYRDRRAVLVICETINRAQTVHRCLGDQEAKKGLFISNNMDNRDIFAKELEGGDIIIATNLAGRGADFKVSDGVKAAGGLFVIQTFLPENSRVEAQAFGRTARQGSPGSAQLIVCRSHLPEPLQNLSLLIKCASSVGDVLNFRSYRQAKFVLMLKEYQRSQRKDTSPIRQTLVSNLTTTSDSEINEVKLERDRTAAARLTALLENDIPKMKTKAELFQQFLCVRDKMTATFSKAQLSALNEYWAFWLLVNSDNKDSAQTLSRDLDNAKNLIVKGVSPLSNLHHYTTAGNELLGKGSYQQGILSYTRAILEDPCWAAFAYYNRAFARLRQSSHQDQKCIRQAMEDLNQAQASVQLYRDQIGFTWRCSKRVRRDPSISRFDHHLKSRQKVLVALMENIDAALKKLDKAKAMGGFVKVDRRLVHFLEPVNGLLLPCVLLVALDNNPLELLALMSHPSFDLFHELECLKSLGLCHIYTLDTVFSFTGFLSKALGF